MVKPGDFPPLENEPSPGVSPRGINDHEDGVSEEPQYTIITGAVLAPESSYDVDPDIPISEQISKLKANGLGPSEKVWVTDKRLLRDGKETVDYVRRLGLVRAKGTRKEIIEYFTAMLNATLDGLEECQIKDVGMTWLPERTSRKAEGTNRQ